MKEFEFLNKNIIKGVFPPVNLGVGDDCSVMDWKDDKFLIQSTDCLVENVHFRLSSFSMEEIAYKALAVNISDIAAMGGTPLSVHLSLAVPPNIKERDLQLFFKSFYSIAEAHNIQLIGGDLSSSTTHFFINVAISGEVKKSNIKYRKGLGQNGVLAVTGKLGESAAGLHCLEHNIYDVHAEPLIAAHKNIPIELDKAKWLGERNEILGMMDLSDGLASDLKRVEGAKITVDLESLPITENMRGLAQVVGCDPIQWAVCGGEDYRLLINCQEHQWEELNSSYQRQFGESLLKIGKVQESRENQIEFHQEGLIKEISWKGFQHF